MKRLGSRSGSRTGNVIVVFAVVIIMVVGAVFAVAYAAENGYLNFSTPSGNGSHSSSSTIISNGLPDLSVVNAMQGAASLTTPAWSRYLPSATGFTAPYDSPGGGSPTAGTVYCGGVSSCGPQSAANDLPGSGWWESISATHSYQFAFNTAQACGGGNLVVLPCTYSPPGYPGASYTITAGQSGSFSYQNIQAILPTSITAQTATLGAVSTTNVTLINGFGGTTLPTGAPTITAQVSSDPGGKPTDACVQNSILGTQNAPVVNYGSYGSSSQSVVNNGAVTGYCLALVVANESSTFNVVSGANALGNPLVTTTAGISAELFQITNAQTGTSGNQGVTNSFTFSVNSQVSGHIAIIVVVFDIQQPGYISQHITNQFSPASSHYYCAASGTFCGNQSDVTVGTAFQFTGVPAGWNYANWATTTSAPNNGWAAPQVNSGAGEVLA